MGGILVSTLMGHCPLAHMPIYILLLGLFGQYNCCLVFSTNTWIGYRGFSFFISTLKMRQVGYKVLIIVLKWRKYTSCIYKTWTRPRFSFCVDTLMCSRMCFLTLFGGYIHIVGCIEERAATCDTCRQSRPIHTLSLADHVWSRGVPCIPSYPYFVTLRSHWIYTLMTGVQFAT